MKAASGAIFSPSDSEVHSLLAAASSVPVFQTPEIAEVFARTHGTQAWLRGVAGPNGELRASLLSTIYLFPPWAAHASIRGGPVVPREEESDDAASRVLLLAHEHDQRYRTLYTRVYPAAASGSDAATAESCGFARGPWLNFVLPISTEEDQWRMLSKARRKGILKAQNAGLTIRSVADSRDLREATRLFVSTARRNRFPPQPPGLFQQILDRLVRRGLALFLVAEWQGITVSSRIVLTYRHTAYDWFAGSNPVYRHLHADELLVWSALGWARERGFHSFDFGGAGVPDRPYGPREFKRRFGGPLTEPGRYTMDHFPKTRKLLQSVYEFYQGTDRP